MRLSLLLVTFATLNSCSHGLNVTGCVVDAKNEGFQCATSKKKFFIPFEKGTQLKCASPADTEALLKACKAHQVMDVTVCSYVEPRFLCTETNGNQYQDIPDHVDNYFCLSDKDRKRLFERCK